MIVSLFAEKFGGLIDADLSGRHSKRVAHLISERRERDRVPQAGSRLSLSGKEVLIFTPRL